ncbi:monofunctional biosynthetic peptidoglycan transglycosylase [Methylocaldum sp.]|uniref:monofunctional biosynthetic peptidoglycan transglycosylase n=1 Tax=Methylocaldum sp. TaxID=1969727 RepID=UPI002D2D9EE4|nr:monofunctional biosynthetic peptidoglycan transglycosylase [Methylocaldum sp.]HYE36099.1 monofunctional biosynthetic peptidoglycan transglycosylase [Methylocaldum sp.]
MKSKPANPKSALRNILRKLVLTIVTLTVVPVALLRWLPPPTSAFMLRAHFLAIIEGKPGLRPRYRWTSWNEISPYAKVAVIAAEDQLFDRHYGFDLKAIGKAWRHNQHGKHVRGASTISQQVAKNLFLYPGQNYVRKALEAYFTTLIELMWPKRRILEIYLNIAQFGEGVFGVSAAGEAFFAKPPSKLNPNEAALLAAVLPNPVRLRADKPSAYVMHRRLWILRQMRQLGGPDYLRNV